mgnify:CR=1 FL=1
MHARAGVLRPYLGLIVVMFVVDRMLDLVFMCVEVEIYMC